MLKVTTVKNVWFFIIGFLLTESNFMILYATVAMICNISNIIISTVKTVDYCCIIHNISKSEAIDLLKNSINWRLWVYIKQYSLIFSLLKAVFFVFFCGFFFFNFSYFFLFYYLYNINWLIVNIAWTSINLWK